MTTLALIDRFAKPRPLTHIRPYQVKPALRDKHHERRQNIGLIGAKSINFWPRSKVVMAMATRSKAGSPTLGGSASDSSDDSKEKFLISYTRQKGKSESKDTCDAKSESGKESVTRARRTPKKGTPTPKKKGLVRNNSNGSESKKESEDTQTERMSEAGSEKGDHDSSSSVSSSDSSSASSSNRSTPNREIDNEKETKDGDNKSESGDNKSESGESSSGDSKSESGDSKSESESGDNKSESGDNKSESGDSKSESGESVNEEKKEKEENVQKEPVAMETNDNDDATKQKEEETSTPTKENATAKSKSPMKSPQTKGSAASTASAAEEKKEDSGEREYIIRTRAGRSHVTPPVVPPSDTAPLPQNAEAKNTPPKPAKQTENTKSTASPGPKNTRRKTPAKAAQGKTPTPAEPGSVSSAELHPNSSNDSSSTSSIWRKGQATPTKTDAEERDGPQLIEEGKRRLTVANPDGKKAEKDYFCWVCHKEGPLFPLVSCQLCPRTYHVKCLNVETVSDTDWVCSECERVLRAECTDTQSKAMSMLGVDQLCVTLKFALARMKHSSSEPFLRPVDTLQVPNYLDFIFNPMDLGTIEKSIKKKMYGSTEAFLADAKWILHNCIVFNGLHHKLTTGAKTIVKICRHEMSEIEVCPDCYMNAAYARSESWFCDPCRFPHTLVWAKLKGYPFWPAKALREENGYVDCRFFGAHDRAWVQVTQVYLLSKDIPTQMKKSKAGFEESLEELELHIKKLKEKFGDFHYFPPKTPYKDLESLAAQSPKKDTKLVPEKSSQKDDQEATTKSTSASPTKYTPMSSPARAISSRYAGSNVFTTLSKELDASKGPFGSPTLSERSNGKGANAKEGVFTISDSALAETSPLTLPSLNRSFATKAKLPDKSMLDKIMKKLQSDEDEASDNEEKKEKKESPKAKQVSPEKMDCSEKDPEKTKNKDGNKDTEVESKQAQEDMEVDAAPSSSAPLPDISQNRKPNPFLESLVNSCKKKLGVDSLNDLKDPSSDESGDEDSSSSSSSSSSADESDDDDDDEDGSKKKENSKLSSKKEKSKKGKESAEKEGSTVVQNGDKSDGKQSEKTENHQSSKNLNSVEDKTVATSKAVDTAAKNSESILMQFLTNSTVAQGQKRPHDESSASAAKKLRPTTPPGNLPSSAAAAGPVSASGFLDNKDGGSAQNTYGFSVDKYFQKALGGLKEVFHEMAADILTQGADNVLAKHVQREIEQMKWKHEQECQELRHNAELTLAEMRMSWELERDRAVKEVKQQCLKVKDKAIEDAKKRQWCAQCGKEAMFYCCWNTSYCDYPCQQRHWPLHMNYCTQTQGGQSLDSATSQSQPSNQSHDTTTTTKTTSSTTLSAQALTEQVQRAIQSTNSGGTKKPWQEFPTFDSVASIFSLPQFLPSIGVPTIAPPMLSSIYGNYSSAGPTLQANSLLGPTPQSPTSPIQIAGGKIKVPQVAMTGPQKNMVYAVQVPQQVPQPVSLSPGVPQQQPTSGNSLIKNPGNITAPSQK